MPQRERVDADDIAPQVAPIVASTLRRMPLRSRPRTPPPDGSLEQRLAQQVPYTIVHISLQPLAERHTAQLSVVALEIGMRHMC